MPWSGSASIDTHKRGATLPAAANIALTRPTGKFLMLTVVSADECIPILVFQLPVDILLHTPEMSARPLHITWWRTSAI